MPWPRPDRDRAPPARPRPPAGRAATCGQGPERVAVRSGDPARAENADAECDQLTVRRRRSAAPRASIVRPPMRSAARQGCPPHSIWTGVSSAMARANARISATYARVEPQRPGSPTGTGRRRAAPPADPTRGIIGRAPMAIVPRSPTISVRTSSTRALRASSIEPVAPPANRRLTTALSTSPAAASSG